MNNRDELNELRDQLRQRADRTQPTSDLIGGSLARARGIRRRRTVVAAVTAVVVAAGGIAGAGALRGQWGGSGEVPVAGVTATPSTSAGSPSAEPSEAPRTTTAPTAPDSSAATGDPRSSTDSTEPTPDPSRTDPSTPSPDTSDTTTPAPPPPPETSTHQPSSSRSLGTKQHAPLCTADETTVEVRAGQGAAGHIEYVITLTNTGERTCTALGYPGVSIVAGDDGQQIGAPADRDRDHGSAEPVAVRPGGTATASLLVAQADNHGADCDAVDARGFRIYLPEERSAQFAPADVRGCRSDDVHLMQVRPFVAG